MVKGNRGYDDEPRSGAGSEKGDVSPDRDHGKRSHGEYPEHAAHHGDTRASGDRGGGSRSGDR